MRNLNSLTVRFALVCVVLTLAVCSATAQSWQVQYDGSVLPTAASPPWDYVGNASFGSITSGILRVNDTSTGQYLVYWKGWSASNSTGCTVETRMMCSSITAKTDQYDVELHDGTKTAGFLLYTDRIVCRTTGAYYSLTGNQYHVYRFTLQGTTWNVYLDGNATPIMTGAPANSSLNEVDFGSTSFTGKQSVYFDYLYYTAAGAYPPGGGSPPGQATNPSPANGATGVSTSAQLSWSAGSGATSHDVYFGTTSPGTFRGNQAGTTYNPGTLNYSTVYYWRIDEKNAYGTTTGPVWHFTTGAAPTTRFNATLQNGTTVTVDNVSQWSNDWVGGLVLAADRSTQEDSPYDMPCYKGLMKTGDRVCVTNNYLAWFDSSTGDGVNFAPPYGNTWTRAGQLTGWWTLDPSTSYFKYWKTGPNGYWNWAHNELIPGSCSPNQDQHWWDQHGFPLEHTIAVDVGGTMYFMSYPYTKQTPTSGYTVLADGVVQGDGVHYKSSAKMASWTYNCDVTDGYDGNGISNWIDAEVEYVCRPNDIYCRWRFKPNNANVTASNLYIAAWTAYAQDEDGTACDVYAPTSQWPGTVYGQPIYNQSSRPLWRNYPSPYGPFPAGTIVTMTMGQTCSSPYYNVDIVTNPGWTVGDGDYIRCGESPSLSSSMPRWQFLNLGVPNSGNGTYDNAYHIQWHDLISWNETHDGTFGFGAGRGPFTDPADFITLQSGVWYQGEFTLSTNF